MEARSLKIASINFRLRLGAKRVGTLCRTTRPQSRGLSCTMAEPQTARIQHLKDRLAAISPIFCPIRQIAQ